MQCERCTDQDAHPVDGSRTVNKKGKTADGDAN